MFDLKKLDKTWTLFLDRDGVINQEKQDGYINFWEEFAFYPGVPEAVGLLSKIFGHIIVITNQRGIAKGETKKEHLENIHSRMIAALEKAGGKIDRLYYCPDLDDSSANRKPNPGMGLRAATDFPFIDLSRSIMVGNNLSDMQFGRNLGSQTVFLTTTHPDTNVTDSRIDAIFDSLLSFALALPA